MLESSFTRWQCDRRRRTWALADLQVLAVSSGLSHSFRFLVGQLLSHRTLLQYGAMWGGTATRGRKGSWRPGSILSEALGQTHQMANTAFSEGGPWDVRGEFGDSQPPSEPLLK